MQPGSTPPSPNSPAPLGDMASVEPALLLRPTPFINSDHPQVIQFARDAIAGTEDEVEKGVRLFYAVRDQIRYDPYRLPVDEEGYRASSVLKDKSAYCIPKSNLLAAAARAVGIPSAVGYADVRNHLTTEKLRENMGSDIFIYHGYTLLKLDGKWVKATAAFNLSLCERFQVLPLEFDGRSDALFHPFDANNRRHMEYVNDRGNFAEFPYREIMDAFNSYYPNFGGGESLSEVRFEDEKPLTP